MERISLLFRSAMYALRDGFLIRPFVIAIVLGTAGAVLSSLEEAVPQSTLGFRWLYSHPARILKSHR